MKVLSKIARKIGSINLFAEPVIRHARVSAREVHV